MIIETYNCPRITSTPPPCPSATSTNAVIAPTSSLSRETDDVTFTSSGDTDVMSTPRPTSVPAVLTEPTKAVLQPVTDGSTLPGLVTDNHETIIPLVPTPTAADNPHDKDVSIPITSLTNQNPTSIFETPDKNLPLIIGIVLSLLISIATIVAVIAVIICVCNKVKKIMPTNQDDLIYNSAYNSHSRRLSSVALHSYLSIRSLRHPPADNGDTTHYIAMTDNIYCSLVSPSTHANSCDETTGHAQQGEGIAMERNEAYGLNAADNESCDELLESYEYV